MNDKRKRPSVDPKVFELAEHFLEDDPERYWRYTGDDVWELAGEIQLTIEDFFAAREAQRAS
jgi:hypothetical protein